ncbi:hypothetical protein [Shewanella sp. SR43-8]|uniref:hypothetical protein n=1 Tax=Shewanella sp. SR43-8 TaxID=2760938 RepID=UPI0015FFFB23|nr:hypothetical protein [Shewanella sp. SR43-8]MBB1321986.1 hypothetical protein [Shewanella sp. SR43-8]
MLKNNTRFLDYFSGNHVFMFTAALACVEPVVENLALNSVSAYLLSMLADFLSRRSPEFVEITHLNE